MLKKIVFTVIGLPVAFIAIAIASGRSDEPRAPVKYCSAAHQMEAATGGRTTAAQAAKLMCDDAAAREGIQALVDQRYGVAR